MDRRMALVGVAALAALVLFVVTDTGSEPPESTLGFEAPTTTQPTSQAPPDTSTTTIDPVAAARSAAVAVVEQYWAALSSDGSSVVSILDVAPDDLIREVGLAEYSA
ncbi:MAG: hypothetical protein HKN91_10520, partial [Acidimicrobiia bacterium]|nr:hypothetical protein [Acidimicrobiia bacterium]